MRMQTGNRQQTRSGDLNSEKRQRRRRTQNQRRARASGNDYNIVAYDRGASKWDYSTFTNWRISTNRDSLIPRICIKCSARRKGPFSSRKRIIFSAVLRPICGNLSSSSTELVLIFTASGEAAISGIDRYSCRVEHPAIAIKTSRIHFRYFCIVNHPAFGFRSYCSFSISARSCRSSYALSRIGRARVEPSISPI